MNDTHSSQFLLFFYLLRSLSGAVNLTVRCSCCCLLQVTWLTTRTHFILSLINAPIHVTSRSPGFSKFAHTKHKNPMLKLFFCTIKSHPSPTMQYISSYMTLLLVPFMSKLCLMILITGKTLSSYNLEHTVLISLTKINFKGFRR